MRAIALLGALPALARAGLPAAITVRGEGECPAARAVASTLGRLWPAVAVTVGDGQPAALAVEIVDHGDAYDVRVAGRRRAFVDPAHRCAERAKTAAVYVVVTLAPPTIALPALGAAASAPASAPASTSMTVMPALAPKPAPIVLVAPASSLAEGAVTAAQAPPPTEPAPARPAVEDAESPVARRSAREILVEAGGLVAATPALGALPGFSVGGALLGTHLGVAAGVSVLAPSTLVLAGESVSLARVPVDVALRVRSTWGPFGVAADVGLEAAPLTARGQAGSPVLLGGTRLEVGPTAAARIERALRPGTSVFFAFRSSYLPHPYRLLFEPSEVLGTTPRLWLSGTVGLAVAVL